MNREPMYNVFINKPSHMTKMATMPIYSKHPSKISFSGTAAPVATNFNLTDRQTDRQTDNMFI